ncbi:angiotensin-converting enzyme domain-containing protein [Ditylenchus destructor]|uniref:Angiotensin-converting enzyme n=1 Tax=Ditylenchus destructor TaxID=166010 RepID=A0AAD4NEZ9_9BILA|nr:angiotensin-converting enzyme domain-containing protein [Ditylenchus destructor]
MGNIRGYLWLSVTALLLSVYYSQAKELFDDLSVEDYSESVEPTKPDGVDNEAIQQLIDKFLNKGTLEEVKEEKVNKEAQALVNSSAYWSLDNLVPEHSIGDSGKAAEWLRGYTVELEKILHQVAFAGWNYFTSASPITKQYLEEAEEIARLFLKSTARQARQFDVTTFADPNPSSVASQIELVMKEGMNALNSDDLNEYNRLLVKINQVYTSTAICELASKEGTPCLIKFSDFHSLLQNSHDIKETLDWWNSWRGAAGGNLTEAYSNLIEITNKAAKLNGFTNGGAMWRSVFEMPDKNGQPQNDIQAQVENCYQQILPFYKQLHAYFRPRLASIYVKNGKSEDMHQPSGITKDGPLPAHLLKSLSGESWSGHYELTKPFSDVMEDEPKTSMQILENFRSQNYTSRTMFIKVYRFMKYLGFEHLPPTVWKKSIFSRNWSKDMICNPATAYDMVNGDDYRIKVCAQLSESDFAHAHSLMAQLYSKYSARHQPLLLRESPNPAISSALSGAFQLLASNFDYLKAQKLIDEKTDRSEPAEINRLYKEALDRVVYLPFAVVADKWRYSAFEGAVNKDNWSELWWKLREQYQGIKGPSGSAQDQAASAFDAVVSPAITQQHAPALRNFISYVAQFQILNKLCADSNRTSTSLSQGCIPNKETMKTVIDTLSMGGAISWVDALERMTGSRQLDAGPLLQYYEPLISWLSNINQHEQVVLGWEGTAGEQFTPNEIPDLRDGSVIGEQGQVLPGEDRIAYPGGSCVNGQECLLDSVCNGSICVCNASFYTLQIADTYNCVPGNPALAGFADPNQGGLIIALNPNNASSPAESTTETTMSETKSEAESKIHANGAVRLERWWSTMVLAASLFISVIYCFL